MADLSNWLSSFQEGICILGNLKKIRIDSIFIVIFIFGSNDKN